MSAYKIMSSRFSGRPCLKRIRVVEVFLAFTRTHMGLHPQGMFTKETFEGPGVGDSKIDLMRSSKGSSHA